MRLVVSKHIYSALTASAELNKAVGKKIYPDMSISRTIFQCIFNQIAH